MEKEFIPYKESLALRELGFDEGGLGIYVNRNLVTDTIESYHFPDKEVIHAPLYQQAFRWFREKYNLHSHVRPDGISSKTVLSWQWHILFWNPKKGGYWHEKYEHGVKEHKEAQLACIQQLIKLVRDERKENNP